MITYIISRHGIILLTATSYHNDNSNNEYNNNTNEQHNVCMYTCIYIYIYIHRTITNIRKQTHVIRKGTNT